jgi:hypothetical protein
MPSFLRFVFLSLRRLWVRFSFWPPARSFSVFVVPRLLLRHLRRLAWVVRRVESYAVLLLQELENVLFRAFSKTHFALSY